MTGKPTPVPMQRGSHFEGIIDVYVDNEPDFAEAHRLGVRAVWYRTSIGLYVDDREAYRDAKSRALKAGMMWGAYHVVDKEDVVAQVDRFLEIEDGNDPTVAMAVDWESTKKGELDLNGVRAFMTEFERQKRFYPMLYAGHQIREAPALKHHDRILANCPLWYVRVDKPEDELGIPPTWASYTLWQYDNEDRKNGSPYPESVLKGADFNRFRGDKAALRAAWPFQARH